MASIWPSTDRSRSFRPEFVVDRQPGYRTPSPPRQCVEPLSPNTQNRQSSKTSKRGASTRRSGAKYNAAYHTHMISDSIDSTRPRISGAFEASNYDHAISRQQDTHLQVCPSPLDLIATLATSHSLAGLPYSRYDDRASTEATPEWPSNSVDRFYRGHHRHSSDTGFERPAKRQRLDEADLHYKEATRPATSYADAHDVRSLIPSHGSVPLSSMSASTRATQQEAELLLGLSQGYGQGHDLQSYPRQLENDSSLLNGFRPPAPPFLHNEPPWPFRPGLESSDPPDTYASAFAKIASLPRLHDPRASAELDRDAKLGWPKAATHEQELPKEEPPAKPRVYKGWPKGKPRGPRNSNGETKKTSKGAGKRAAERQSTATEDKPLDQDVTTPMSPHTSHAHAIEVDVRPKQEADDLSGLVDQSNVAVIPTALPQPSTKDETTICPACKRTKDESVADHDTWIGCNGCKEWFHTSCAGFETEKKVKDVDKFFCRDCEKEHGPTTFVRKSARAHASIDYAGLNEGKVRAAVDVAEHHYIQPIKDGTLNFQPETFPRMPPELVTADFFQRSGTMSEPILIPAHLNRSPWITASESPSEPIADDLSPSEQPQDPDSGGFEEELEYDCVEEDGQDKLGMVIPQGLTVRRVAELYGPEEKVEVIDVKSQEGEDKRWNMRQWADYYEQTGEKPVRNVISLEVSQSKLGRLIRRPKVVRDLDLQDSVWPQEETAKGIFPKVQFYCLMSVADCYTDFHIDFGGSSVYYHILKGRKTFFFIPPKPKYLKKYEEWCNSNEQNNVFLGDLCGGECFRVDLFPGDTMLIPSGWIHAVWTPTNSLVIGGNFLTRMHYGMQIQVNEIEKNTGVARKFRYPYFQKVLWQAVVQYLQRDPIPSTVLEQLWDGKAFKRTSPVYEDYDQAMTVEDTLSEEFNARYYPRGEIEGLADLLRYVHRTVVVVTGKASGIAKSTQDAVARSMPKGYGDPVDLLKTFAAWVAWKRGNETLPQWSLPSVEISENDITPAAHEKKRMDGRSKRGDRESSRVPPERRSQRQQVPIKSSTEGDSSEILLSGEDQPTLEATSEKNVKAGMLNGFGVKRVDQKESSPKVPLVTEAPLPSEIGVSHPPAVPPFPYSMPTTPASVRVHDVERTEQDFIHATPPSVTTTPPNADVSSIKESVGDDTKFPIVDGQASSIKTSRSKACPDCRKSKRRCIHDENGGIDPIKAQETPVPRGPRGTKRPRQSDSAGENDAKKPRQDFIPIDPFLQDFPTESKMDEGVPDSLNTHTSNADQPHQSMTFTVDVSNVDPALENDSLLTNSSTDGVQNAKQSDTSQDSFKPSETKEASRAAAYGIQPISIVSTVPLSDAPSNLRNASRTPSVHVQSASTESADASHSDRRSSPPTDPETVFQQIYHVGLKLNGGSEAQQSSGLKSEDNLTDPKQPTTPRHTPRKVRRESSLASASPAKSINGSSAKRRSKSRSVSKDVGKSGHLAGMARNLLGKGVFGTGSAVVEEGEGDEDMEEDPSVRLAKELAAQDHGLRRRS